MRDWIGHPQTIKLLQRDWICGQVPVDIFAKFSELMGHFDIFRRDFLSCLFWSNAKNKDLSSSCKITPLEHGILHERKRSGV